METTTIDGHTLLAAAVGLPLEAGGISFAGAGITRRLNARYSRNWSAAQWLTALEPALKRYDTAHLRP